jgi:hypothetical protein
MKRLLFVLLMMISSVSWAEWERISNDGDSYIYADRETIRKKGNFVEMWRLKNYFRVQDDYSGNKYKSSKLMTRYDCNDRTGAVVSLVHFSEEYGQGDVVFSGTRKKNEINDEPIVPGSVGEVAWQIACGKK